VSIPMGQEHETMKDWRPISLCNVLYKLLVKVLAKILKHVIHKCVSDNQSTFVSRRSILDNAMIAIEVVHHTKFNKRCKKDVRLRYMSTFMALTFVEMPILYLACYLQMIVFLESPFSFFVGINYGFYYF